LTDIVRVADEYYVGASSALVDDRTRVLKCGDTFAVLNHYGDIEDLGFSQFGFFHAESRHLSRFSLRLNQQQPLLLGSTVRDDNAFLSVDVTNVDTALSSEERLPRGTIHVFRSQFLSIASRYEQIRILNYGLNPYGSQCFFSSMPISQTFSRCAAQSASEKAIACLIKSTETQRSLLTEAWMVCFAARVSSSRRIRPRSPHVKLVLT
jgi:glycogen debranching enzyme